ncbi:MAG: M56 family metallopeptidase [Bryobacteraceae bacterium]
MMFELALKATVILAAAFVINACWAARPAASRHAVWTAAFAGLLAMPALAMLLPAWEAVPDFVYAVSAAGAPNADSTVAADPLVRIWYSGIFLVLARVALSHLLLWRTVRRRGAVAAPIAWGVFRPEILLPPGDVHPAVLRHEQAHVDRHDGLWLLFAQVACAVYWFHPLVWMAASKSAEERERACDDRVLENARGVDYADALLKCARAASSAAVLSATDSLERRLRAILDPGVDRRSASRRFLTSSAAVTLLLLLPIAACGSKRVYKMADVTDGPHLVSKVEPKYTEQAREAKIAGTCILSVVVGADGRAQNIQVKRSLDAGLDREAMAAVEQWRFEPGRRRGKPVAVAATIEVNFRLM